MKKTICFSAFGAYPILNEESTFYNIGGAELQQVIVGKELARRGYCIKFIDFDYGQEEVDYVDGIQIIKTFKPTDRVRLASYILNTFNIVRAFYLANPDIVYQRSGIYFIPLLYAKIFHKKYIYAIPHDSFVEKEKAIKLTKNRTIHLLKKLDTWMNIKLADVIIAQSHYQQQQLNENYHKEAVLVRSAYCIQEKQHSILKSVKPLVLWVGTIREWKRPSIFVELAKKLPSTDFCMIGGPSEQIGLYDTIKNQNVPNFQFIGFVPYKDIDKFFENAWLFINTSDKEGFPNTFLQSWANCTPVVSLNVNPDNLLKRERVGIQSETFDQMVSDVQMLLQNRVLRDEYGENGEKYVANEHDVNKVVEKYIKILESL